MPDGFKGSRLPIQLGLKVLKLLNDAPLVKFSCGSKAGSSFQSLICSWLLPWLALVRSVESLQDPVHGTGIFLLLDKGLMLVVPFACGNSPPY